MTIYKPKNLSEEKSGKLKSVSSEVDRKLLLKTEQDVENLRVVIRKRRAFFGMCALTLLFLMGILCAGIGFLVYKHSHQKVNPYQKFMCGNGLYNVKYHGDPQNKLFGTFKEKVEIGSHYEKISMPQIRNYLGSTILHDFEQNYTAVVDREKGKCYVLPLNRTIVRPPKSFNDLLEKFQNGYYFPDAEILNQNYYVEMNPMLEPGRFGAYIEQECSQFEIYQLRKEIGGRRGFALKRSSISCPMQGDEFCLGNTFARYMPCIQLTKCI